MMGKTKTKTLIISFLLAAVAACLSVALVACSGGEEKDSRVYNVGEEGVYYYDATSSAEYLMTLQSGTYMISTDGYKGYSGTYSYDATAGAIAFTDSSGDKFEAAFSDDAMQLAISGTDYTFLKKVDYTVEFKDGSSTVGTQSVTYGKNASKIDAEKDGYIFIGWYEDAAFTTRYGFNTAVTADTTLYAYYIPVDTTIANFEVQFVSGGDVIYTTTTQNGVVYDFPETEVAGWWVSATNDENELTYEYKGEILTESTKLFAVESYSLGASVYGDGLKWSTNVATATITVDGNPVTSAAAGTSFAYDFDSLSAGRHEITISASGASENLVYVTKALSRVSNFSVYGTTLVYNAVENAEYYYVSVTCGNASHDHEMVYNGNTLTYDFSNCEMGPDGISFTVYAYANGYVESVSDTFVYALILDGTTVTIDSATDTASWTAVSGASGYEIYINGEYTATTTDTEYSFKYYEKDAEIEMAVKPVAPGYYSETSEAVSYEKATLKAPEIVAVSGYEISWEEIVEAVSYELNINGYLVEVESTKYLLSDTDLERISDVNMNAISVMAIAETPSENSQYGDIMYMTDKVMSAALSYADGVISWQYALAADSYIVSVDGSEETVTGVNTYDVTFTHSGEIKINVYFMLDGEQSAVAKMSLTTYAVIFDSRGGVAVDTIYVAKGDTLNLAVLTSDDYEIGRADFSGWYTLPDLTGDYDSLTYGGGGTEMKSGDTFNLNSSLVLYAFWTRQRVNVTLNAGDYGEFVEDESESSTSSTVVEVPYGSDTYVIDMPECTEATRFFLGYFTEPNGRGTQYTDATGKLIVKYNNIYVTSLYAAWGEAIVLTETTYQNQRVLEVSKGADIDSLPGGVLTIPATYTIKGTELPVGVVGAAAFNSCKKLVEINIPDTVLYISTVNNGYSSGSGAFAQCSSLRYVNIYATGEEEETKEVFYYSDEDGLLYRKTSSGGVELIYYPYARTETDLVIPGKVCNEHEVEIDGTGYTKVYRDVTGIASRVFYQHTLYSVTIPSSVTTISVEAFYLCGRMESLIFEESADGNASGLTIEANAFESCRALTTVTLPARLESLDIAAFNSCSALTEINVSDGGKYSSKEGLVCVGTEVFLCPAGRSGVVTIPSGVTSVGESAFADCTLITGIVIPGYVTKISKSAFSGCKGLTDITFEDDENYNELEIQTLAFYNCANLTEVYLPARLTKLAEASFSKTSSLTTVHYDSRKGATVGDLSGLEDNAFATAESSSGSRTYYVTTLYLGANVPAIDFASIFGGNKLATVIIDEDNPNFCVEDDTSVVYDKDMTRLLYYPAGRLGDYEIPYGVESISSYAFSAKTYLTGVTIPSSVTEISEFAFYNSNKLTKVTFIEAEDPASAEDLVIEGSAFRGCSALTEISFPERTTEIADYALYGCTSLKTVKLPATLEKFGTYDSSGNLTSVGNMFSGCDSLQEIIVADGNKYFTTVGGILYLQKTNDTTGEYEASELIKAPTQLKDENANVSVPLTVSKIWSNAFNANESIKSFEMEGTAVYGLTLGDGVFTGAANLKTVVLPDGLTAIPNDTFKDCASLVEVTVPYTVATIGTSAFYDTYSLYTVVFEDVPEGERDDDYPLTFADCKGSTAMFRYSGLKELIIPDRTVALGEYMCYQSRSLETLVIGKNVTVIPQYAFSETMSVKSLTFAGGDDNKLTKINSNAFGSALRTNHGTTEITIPKGVTEIATSAFAYGRAIRKVTLPDGLTSIGGSAFNNCTYLEEINIPASVTTIDSNAFNLCERLKTVTFEEEGDTVGAELEIGTTAFAYCEKLTGVVIPSRTTSLGLNLFKECVSISSITFAVDGETGLSGIESIGNGCFATTAITEFSFPETGSEFETGTGVFENCKRLTKVYISSKMSDIDGLFTGCYSIKEIEIAEGNQNFMTDSGQPILYSITQGTIIYVFGELTKDVVIADVVTDIGTNAFMGQNTVVSVRIPNSVKSIGASAFTGCTYLTKVTFYQGQNGKADSLELGDYAFYDCSHLTTFGPEGTAGKIDLSDVTKIGVNAFTKCVSVTSASMPTADGVTIGNYLFSECTSLVNVTFAGSLTALPNYMFTGCTALETIVIPDGVTDTGLNAFQNCTNLKNVTLPETLTTLGNYAFQYCYSLEELDISHVGTFGMRALSYTSLKEITLPENSTIAVNGMEVFGYNTSLVKVYVPASFTQTNGNTLFTGCTSLTVVEFENGATTSNGMFTDCVSLASVDLSGVASISQNAFKNCSALKEVDLSGVTSLGSSAFTGCTSLESVILGSFTTLDTSAFDGCTALRTVAKSRDSLVEGFADLTGMTTKIGNYALRGTAIESVSLPAGTSTTTTGTGIVCNCEHLTKVTFAEGTTYIGIQQFQNCTALKEIVIPSGVTAFGTSLTTGYTFDGCTSLETVVFDGTITRIAGYMFQNCTSLKSINIPWAAESYYLGSYSFAGSGLEEFDMPKFISTTYIGQYIFDGCANLREVTFADGLTTLNTYTFRGCTSLEEISFPDSLDSIPNYTFRNCTGLKSVDLSGIDTIGNYAFRGCTSLESLSLPETVYSVGTYAFADCTGLMTADLSYLSEIPNYMFSGCTKLESVTLGSNLISVGDGVFSGCRALESIDLDEDCSLFTLIDGNLYTSSMVLVVVLPTKTGELVLPAGTTLSAYIFDGTMIEKVVLCENMTEIPAYAFANSNVAEVVVSGNVVAIGEYAFADSAIVSFVIPDSVTEIGGYAFYETLELTSVTLGGGISEISEYMFAGSGITSITVPANVTIIGEYAFSSTSNLSSITFSVGLEKIGSYAFLGSAVESVELPESVVDLGYGVFAQNENLKSVKFTEGIVTILEGNAVEISGSGTSQKDLGMFYACTSLTNVELGTAVTEIGGYTFNGCISLTKIDLTGIKNIGNYAFYQSGLTELVIPKSMVNFGDYVFAECTALESVVVEEGFTDAWASITYAKYMFYNDSSLQTVTLPSTLTALPGNYAFSGCTSLTDIVIPQGVAVTGKNMFVGWTENQTIYFNSSYYEITHNFATLSASTGWTYLDSDSNANLCFYMEIPDDTSELYDYGLSYWYYDANGDIVEWTVADLQP